MAPVEWTIRVARPPGHERSEMRPVEAFMAVSSWYLTTQEGRP
jgi:hypothetical protein